jgi:hypothetical protein
MRIHHLPIDGLLDEWHEDVHGDPDLSDGLPVPIDASRAHAYLCRVWGVGRAIWVNGRWVTTWSHFQPDPHGGWASIIMALEDLQELAIAIGDLGLLPATAIALERLDRRGVRPEGDVVLVGEGLVWWYWPEMALGLDPRDVCERLTETFGD